MSGELVNKSEPVFQQTEQPNIFSQQLYGSIIKIDKLNYIYSVLSYFVFSIERSIVFLIFGESVTYEEITMMIIFDALFYPIQESICTFFISFINYYEQNEVSVLFTITMMYQFCFLLIGCLVYELLQINLHKTITDEFMFWLLSFSSTLFITVAEFLTLKSKNLRVLIISLFECFSLVALIELLHTNALYIESGMYIFSAIFGFVYESINGKSEFSFNFSIILQKLTLFCKIGIYPVVIIFEKVLEIIPYLVIIFSSKNDTNENITRIELFIWISQIGYFLERNMATCYLHYKSSSIASSLIICPAICVLINSLMVYFPLFLYIKDKQKESYYEFAWLEFALSFANIFNTTYQGLLANSYLYGVLYSLHFMSIIMITILLILKEILKDDTLKESFLLMIQCSQYVIGFFGWLSHLIVNLRKR